MRIQHVFSCLCCRASPCVLVRSFVQFIALVTQKNFLFRNAEWVGWLVVRACHAEAGVDDDDGCWLLAVYLCRLIIATSSCNLRFSSSVCSILYLLWFLFIIMSCSIFSALFCVGTIGKLLAMIMTSACAFYCKQCMAQEAQFFVVIVFLRFGGYSKLSTT